jgi:hypothetical protein
VDPTISLDDMNKRKFLNLPGLQLQPSVVEPVANLLVEEHNSSENADESLPHRIPTKSIKLHTRYMKNPTRGFVDCSALCVSKVDDPPPPHIER